MTVGKNDLPLGGILAGVGIALVVAWAAAVFLQGWYHQMEKAELQRKVIEPPSEALTTYQAEQAVTMGEYRWIDPENGVVGLPIERAMEIMVERASGEE